MCIFGTSVSPRMRAIRARKLFCCGSNVRPKAMREFRARKIFRAKIVRRRVKDSGFRIPDDVTNF